MSQATEMAHLRSLPRCECGAAATVQVMSGLNALVCVACARCAPRKLRKFKEGHG